MVARKMSFQGFTLMELLIVISVIGILISIAAASYASAQKKARDSRRMSDMKAVQNAMEQYYADNSSAYPAAEGLLVPVYLPGGVPSDPKPPATYPPYTWDLSVAGQYCVCAKLEGSATSGNSGAGCAGFGSPGQFYCVKNLQ